jgi:uncharacterized protein YndB with AHSA1/START domain
MPNTVQLHRVFTAPPERVYRAFTDVEAMVKWLPPHGFTAKVHEMDPRVGGGLSFTNFSTKHTHSFGGKYTEMKLNELIKYNERFDDPNMPGEMQTTITMRKVMCGTELHVTQEGIPALILVEMCYLGWQQSLNLLAQVVEPDIPDGN